jgi:hypothetical protein
MNACLAHKRSQPKLKRSETKQAARDVSKQCEAAADEGR